MVIIKAAIRVWNRVVENTLSIPFRSNGRFYWRSGWAIFAGRSSLPRHTAAEQAVLGAFHSRRVRGGSVRQISRKGNLTTSEGAMPFQLNSHSPRPWMPATWFSNSRKRQDKVRECRRAQASIDVYRHTTKARPWRATWRGNLSYLTFS